MSREDLTRPRREAARNRPGTGGRRHGGRRPGAPAPRETLTGRAAASPWRRETVEAAVAVSGVTAGEAGYGVGGDGAEARRSISRTPSAWAMTGWRRATAS